VKVINNLGTFKNFTSTLYLGEIDPKDFNINYYDQEYKSDKRIIEFEIDNYKQGINLITGVIRNYENNHDITNAYMFTRNLTIPYIFYIQFTVLSPPPPTKRRMTK
jgi:hypothetical protein